MGLLERILQDDMKAKADGLLNRARTARTFANDEEPRSEAFDSEKKNIPTTLKTPPSSNPD